MYAIGIDIGGTNVKFALVDDHTRDAKQYRCEEYPHGVDCDGLCKYIYEKCIALLSDNGMSLDDVLRVGIAIPGCVDYATGVVTNANNIGLSYAPVADILSKLLAHNICVRVLNDADAATVAEHRVGVLAQSDNCALVAIGTGVGAGFILNGKLYVGGKARGTEFGHMTLNMYGNTRCSCGNIGCVESLCSATYVKNRGRQAYSNPDITAKDVFDAAEAGDSRAKGIFNEYCDNLSSALSSLTAILDPEIIAISGGVSLAGEFLLEPVRELLNKKCFFPTKPKLFIATLTDRAGALGAALWDERY